VTKGTKVAENFCSLDCKPITPSRENPLCVRRERSAAARAHVFLTLLAKLLCVGVSLEDWGRACRLGEEVQQEGKNRRLTEIYAPFERYAGEILS